MDFELWNSYHISEFYETVTIKGLRTIFDEDGYIDGHEDFEVTIKVDSLISLCRMMVASEQGEKRKDELDRLGIKFWRETFDFRFFSYKGMQFAVTEPYILLEILTKRLNMKLIEVQQWQGFTIILHKLGTFIIADKYWLNACVFNGYNFIKCFLSIDSKYEGRYSKESGLKVAGYDVIVEIGSVQTAKLEHGACHPYVELKYRDIGILLTYRQYVGIFKLYMGF